MSIKVRATGPGYYGERRYNDGDAFEIQTEKEFSKTWMERDLQAEIIEAGSAPSENTVVVPGEEEELPEHSAERNIDETVDEPKESEA